MTTAASKPSDHNLLQRSVDQTPRDRPDFRTEGCPKNDELIFDASSRKYGQQYANVYYMRLEMLRSKVIKAASQTWNDLTIDGVQVQYIPKVLDVRQDQIVWIVGTVYKEMKLKPNILEDVSAANYGAPPIKREQYYGDPDDSITLEDESGRVILTGNKVKSELLVTGAVVAVLGKEDAAGDFEVIDIKFPEYAPQEPRLEKMSDRPRYLAFTSGLEISIEKDEKVHERSLQMLQEYLTGELGDDGNQQDSSNIVGLILAGNSLDSQKESEEMKFTMGHHKKYDAKPMHILDTFISELALSMAVSIMPGELDPANLTMPQQPMHKALFQNSRRFLASKVFSSMPNPSWWDVEGVSIFGTSGQTINDIHKYMDVHDRLKMMDYTLRWQHCAPTAPDTLWCYPFADNDPFVLEKTPHVYFVGNQDKFETGLVKSRDADDKPIEVRLICIPRFCTTGEIVLMNLDTLETEVVKFES